MFGLTKFVRPNTLKTTILHLSIDRIYQGSFCHDQMSCVMALSDWHLTSVRQNTMVQYMFVPYSHNCFGSHSLRAGLVTLTTYMAAKIGRVTPLVQTWDMEKKTLSVTAHTFLPPERANSGYIHFISLLMSQETSPDMKLK